MSKTVEVYRGYELLASGTVEQCAAKLGVKVSTIRFYLTPTYWSRLSKCKSLDDVLIAIRLDE